MSDFTEKKCPECGQQLRFPKNIGGVLMACPSCGHNFHSDFKMIEKQKRVSSGILKSVFELPGKIMDNITRFFSK